MQSVRLIGLLIGLQLGTSQSIATYARTPAAASSFAVGGGPRSVAEAVDSVRCVTTTGSLDDASGSTLTGSNSNRLTPRWPLSASRALKVKIADAPMIAGWAPAYHDEVVSALRAWGSTGSPVTFRVVTDPEPADIVIHWVDHFDAPYDGWTTVTWEASGRIVTGTVGLAVHSRDGASLSTLERDQVMLHELGHVLGLPHSYSDQSIMRGQVKATEISTDDFQTLRSLYVAPSAMDTTPQDAATDSKTHGCTTVR